MGLIVIEGLDGSGKGTQTGLLFNRLSKLTKVKKVDFPDYSSPSSALVKMYLNGDFGENPNKVNAYAASAFYAVDRFASFVKNWKEDYESGALILADRYTTSNFIYQMGKLPKEKWEEYLVWAEDMEYDKLKLPRPDKVIFLDMPVEVSQGLLSKRYGGDEAKKDIHESHTDFLKHCRSCAEFAGKRLNWHRISCAENGKPRSVEDISDDVFSAVMDAVKQKG